MITSRSHRKHQTRRRFRLEETNQEYLPAGLIPPTEVFVRIRNYLAGRHVGATRDSALLDQVVLVLFAKLYLAHDSGEHKADDDGQRLRRRYLVVLRELREVLGPLSMPAASLSLDDTSLEYVDRCLSSLDLKSTTVDLVGDAYQCFRGSDSRGQEGQFFTPGAAIRALLALVDPQPGERVIDPACGAGGFLFAVAHCLLSRRVPPKDVSRTVYGVEKDEYLARLARMRLSLVTLQRSNVSTGDSLAWSPAESDSFMTRLRPGSYDAVLTNPPFGTRIVAASDSVRRQFSLAYRWVNSSTGGLVATGELARATPPQVLFVEHCLSLVRPGGRVGMVVPESLLSGRNYRHVVDFILSHARVEAVLGMPEALFKTSGKGGTHTKTALILLKKLANTEKPRTYSVFMAEAAWCGHDSRGRHVGKDDLPGILQALAAWRRVDTGLKAGRFGFAIPSDRLRPGILAPRAYDPEVSLLLDRFRGSHYLLRFSDLVAQRALSVTTGDEVGKLAYGAGSVPFVRTSDLSNWEIKSDPKHGVSRETYERLRTKQDVQPGDVLMVKDGTYLIGTCALVTKHDTEIVLQSHIYKIRVYPNELLDSYLLLAILSSAPVQRQIKAHTQTQDIIDSLGRRINDLILPIPRDEQTRQEISHQVQRVIRDRVEARELAREIVDSISSPLLNQGSGSPSLPNRHSRGDVETPPSLR